MTCGQTEEQLGLKDITDRDSVLKAMAEFDRLGQDTFLSKHGFHKALKYVIEDRGTL